MATRSGWDYDTHPGDCHRRRDGDTWTVCCTECMGTGVFPVPWIESPDEGRDDPDASCVACKGSGRAVVSFAAPASLRLDPELVENVARWLFDHQESMRWLCSPEDADWDEWVERNREEWRDTAQDLLTSPMLAYMLAGRERVWALTYNGADEYEHDHGIGDGHNACPACWAQDIRRALTSG